MKKKTGCDTEWLSFSEWQDVAQAFQVLDPYIYLSVVIPAYNEAERLPQTLRRFHEYLTGGGFTYEILVVLDGPSDGTRVVLQELLREVQSEDVPVGRAEAATHKLRLTREA